MTTSLVEEEEKHASERRGTRGRDTGNREALCPRCGYDQAGHIATWRDSCPLAGLCTECGLEFPWSHVLGEAARRAWLYESEGVPGAEGRGGTRRWWATSWRGLRPRRFWRAVDLATPMNGWRLVRFWAVWMVVVHVGCVGVGMVAFLHASSWWMRLIWTERFGRVVLMPWDRAPYVFGQEIAVWWMMFVPLIGMVLTTIVFLVLGETFAKAKVRRRHILRGVCYGGPWCVLVSAPLPVALVGLAALQQYGLLAGSRVMDIVQMISMLIVVTQVAAAVWWWRCFAKEYLKINHTWAVAIVAVLVGGLAEATAFVFCWQVGIGWGGGGEGVRDPSPIALPAGGGGRPDTSHV